MKLTNYADIPQFTRCGHWECHFQLDEAIAWVAKHNVILDPEFQRGHVWTEQQQRAWLEFFLRGGITGRVLYFNCPSWMREIKEGVYDEFVIVDGRQRFETIRKFVAGELEAFGSTINEYQDRMRGHLAIRLNVNDLRTRREVLQWYLEMNTGGTPHTDAEIDKVRAMLRGETQLYMANKKRV